MQFPITYKINKISDDFSLKFPIDWEILKTHVTETGQNVAALPTATSKRDNPTRQTVGAITSGVMYISSIPITPAQSYNNNNNNIIIYFVNMLRRYNNNLTNTDKVMEKITP